jgi:mevalonate kinase
LIARSKYAHGKLLLTGEYLVLEGARALALPLNVGQYLSWKKTREKDLVWNAMKPDGIWFQAKYGLPGLELLNTTDETLSGKLLSILQKTRELNKDFLNGTNGFEVQTILEFDPEFGFGSSSTLISNIAEWAEVDPYALHGVTFGGSGYDIACTREKKPLFYSLVKGKPVVEPSNFDPGFKDKLLFVYLGNKQNSGVSVSNFRKQGSFTSKDIQRINQIGVEMEQADTLSHFEALMQEHEDVMSSVLHLTRVKDLFFKKYEGAVKSLGAWGGDFVLMTFHGDPEEAANYLEKLGFDIYYPYCDLTC